MSQKILECEFSSSLANRAGCMAVCPSDHPGIAAPNHNSANTSVVVDDGEELETTPIFHLHCFCYE